MPELTDLLAPVAQLDLAPAATPAHPLHTCYVPADRMRPGEHLRWGEEALALLDSCAPDEEALAAAVGRPLPPGTYARVRELLAVAPVQDLRVDLEDGYGVRPDDEEDAAVEAAVAALAEAPPPSFGLRVKSLEPATMHRALRTLEGWTAALAGAALPAGIVTLPKAQDPRQVEVAVAVLGELERRTGLRPALELQVETALGVVDRSGATTVAGLLAAGQGTVTGIHFGTYDFTASLGIAPQEQALDNPVADAAKDLLQLVAATHGVPVSDGSTNLLPVGDAGQVRGVWAEHTRLVERGLRRGLWQGWDMHPGHLVSRWTACTAFFLARLPEVRERLAGGRAGVADEPATVRMLEAFDRRARSLGL
ncbi:DUF6986 family protein [Motilibacter rhizosphaerae]|uniref:DUF6986 family protein n=1 Tax=Motilibacter rhizosphaerae TaxID=598652 RepID=UPI0013EE45BB|nr:aldolase/citrate lyase family protein [Motilibacter rhizosphaerae]